MHACLIRGSSEYGQVAQLVEQRTENPRVGGSIPSLATISSSNDVHRLPPNAEIPRFLRCFCAIDVRSVPITADLMGMELFVYLHLRKGRYPHRRAQVV